MPTERDPVAAQYESWIYPKPIADLSEAVAQHGHFDVSDPSLVRRKFWPRKVEPDALDILIAGCGANQAAYIAYRNPESRVVGIDVSEASLGHQRYLKEKHDLRNLELHHLPLEEAASLGQSFDLIISSGVIHHLADPPDALRRLGDVLEPHGVISMMVYGYYPRVGVHMLQDAFRLLGLKQDAEGIAIVKHTLDRVIPRRHHGTSYRDRDPDRRFDAGIVDTYLHPREEAYGVPDILDLVSESQMKFQGWLDNLDYTVSLLLPNPQDPLRTLIEALPIVDQWHVIELIGQGMARHFVLVCRVDRPESDYVLDFTGDAWLDYVPSLRQPITILSERRLPSLVGSATTTTLKRYTHYVELNALETDLLSRVDGKRPIIEIVEDAALDESNALERVNLCREIFRRMAELDYVLYEIPSRTERRESPAS